jgi:hypothetical protein
MSKVSVEVRKASNEPGYLLSVTRRNDSGGATIWPGPRCSSKRTANEVAAWIESNLR